MVNPVKPVNTGKRKRRENRGVSIEVSKDTKNKLAMWKAKRYLTYDQAIKLLLKGGR